MWDFLDWGGGWGWKLPPRTLVATQSATFYSFLVKKNILKAALCKPQARGQPLESPTDV